MLKVFIKISKKTFLILIIVIVLYFTLALSMSLIPISQESSSYNQNHTIYITTNGVHLDIILPNSGLSQKFKGHFSGKISGNFVSFGWGDEDFYLNTPTLDDLTINTAFKAMFLPSKSAIHITFYGHQKRHWKKIKICNHQLSILNQFLFNSFQLEENNQFKLIKSPGYSYHDEFYKAKGSYSCINTCNEWVNSALKEMGIKTAIWSPFDFGVLYHLE